MLTIEEMLSVLVGENETVTIEDYDDFFIIEVTKEGDE